MPVEYEPQVTPERPQSSPQVGLGLLLFQSLPLNEQNVTVHFSLDIHPALRPGFR